MTVPCDQSANTCSIRVPAPGAALVFVSDSAQQAGSAQLSAATFPTTANTKTKNTVTVDSSVLATAQGMSGKDRLHEGGTSPGGQNGAVGLQAPLSGLAAASVFTALTLVLSLRRAAV